MRRGILFAALLTLVVPVLAPASAWTPQDGGFHEPHGGSSGRVSTTGVHPSGGEVAWTTGDLGDLDGPVQLTRDGQVIVWSQTATAVWEMLLLDPADGRTNARVPDVVEGCAAVALDGTIWVQASDLSQIHAVDPADGSIVRSVPSSANRCEGTVQLLPGDRLAIGESCCSERIDLIDLTDGSRVAIPDEPVSSRIFLTSPDGQRGYVVAAGTPLTLLSLALPGGAVLDRLELPGGSLRSSPFQRFLVMPGGRIVLVTDTDVVAVDDDGGGQLSQAWAVNDTDDAGPVPNTLYAIGDDVVAGWQSIGAADTLLGLDLATGEVRFRTPALPGPSGGIAARSGLVDAAGHVILPQVISRTLDGVDYLYDVIDASGVPVGTSPPDLGDGVGGMALAPDGTLYLRTQKDGGEVVTAIRPGVPGLIDIPTTVAPDAVGAGFATVTVEGSAVARVDRLALRRGGDTRYASPLRVDHVPYRAVGRFDLNGAELGTWAVALEVDGVVTDTGETVEVTAPDDKVALDVVVDVPSAVRNGRRHPVVVEVVNRSNIDGIGVPALVTVDLGRGDPRQLIPAFESRVGGDVPDTDPPRVVQAGNDLRTVFVALDHVPAHGTRRLPFVLDVPDGAPDASTVTTTAVVPECHGGAGPAFGQAGPDACIANAARAVSEGILGDIGNGTANCLAMGLSGLSSPTLLPDGTLEIPGEPSSDDVQGLLFDCFTGAVVGAGELPGPATILAYEGIAHQVAVGYLDCRLDQALEGTGADGSGGGGSGGSGFGPGIDSGSTTTGSSVDPNEIQGPPGVGEPRYVTSNDLFGYRILFENLPGAAFAAQTVTVSTTLAGGLVADSVRYGSVGWGGVVYDLPTVPGTTLITPDGADHRVLVTTARVGRDLEWLLETRALTSDGPPEDDAVGFLPPNTSPPAGDGHVSFTVDTDTDIADGAVIPMSAEIVFDTNEPIVTNVWSNTLDSTPPVTAFEPLQDGPSPSNTVTLGWTATDAVAGIAITHVRSDGASKTVPGGQTSTTVTGERGQELAVVAQSVDGAGNVERPGSTQRVTIAVDALDRLAGATRIHTAIAVAEAAFDDAPVVVLARADTYPDSLAGSTIAHTVGAPILLTETNAVPGVLADALRRLETTNALILGGTAAISDAVVDDLAVLGVASERLAGPTRYGTAAMVAAELPGQPRRAFVTEGGNADPRFGWAEALVTAPWAARAAEPLLLVEADRLPDETAAAITDLGVEAVTIVGGPSRVSQAVGDQIALLGVTVERIGTDDRYQTAVDVAAAAAADGHASPTNTWVATGEVFADALSAGAATAATGGQLLLVHSSDPTVSAVVTDAVAAAGDAIRILRIAGGTAAVDPTVEAAIRAALRS